MRTIFEKINIYIYIIIPSIIICSYLLLVLVFNYQLNNIQNYTDNSFNVALTILSVLLTVFGFMLALPENNFRKLIRKYNHEKIVYNTLLIGILSSLLFIIFFILNISNIFTEILFINFLCDTVIATVWVYRILYFMSKSVE